MLNQETTVTLHPHDKLALELGRGLLTYMSAADLERMLDYALYRSISNPSPEVAPKYDIQDLNMDIWQIKRIVSNFK